MLGAMPQSSTVISRCIKQALQQSLAAGALLVHLETHKEAVLKLEFETHLSSYIGIPSLIKWKEVRFDIPRLLLSPLLVLLLLHRPCWKKTGM